MRKQQSWCTSIMNGWRSIPGLGPVGWSDRVVGENHCWMLTMVVGKPANLYISSQKWKTEI
jgi:hypothetical protein